MYVTPIRSLRYMRLVPWVINETAEVSFKLLLMIIKVAAKVTQTITMEGLL